MVRKHNIRKILNTCALEKKSLKEMCREKKINPQSIRRHFTVNIRYMYDRIVLRGRRVGYRYCGVIVFWDHIEEESGKGEIPPEVEPNPLNRRSDL